LVLAIALIQRDFHFDYVVRYTSQLLSWQYSLAALWVGQAGSLLLWAWFLAALAVAFRLLPAANVAVRDSAFGILMGYLAFLVAILVFAADPMQASLSAPKEGLGLSPLLQHPSMMIHPPVIFFAYAAWAVPFALAAGALICGRLDADWVQMARPWALLAWSVLGVGLLLGAHWAYQQLGWGGYWGWDPVENGSLLPWLTGTALVHCMMAWRYRDCLKKTTVALGVLTFGLCNFATFLTRSGVFSSVHAFSESPIGWMFLILLAVLLGGGVTLIVIRAPALAPSRKAKSLLARESLILASTFLLLAFAAVVLAGTLVAPLSAVAVRRTIVIGPPFYNNALMPVGLLLMTVTAAVPLTRWGRSPGMIQRRVLSVCAVVGVVAAAAGHGLGIRHIIPLTLIGLATVAATSFLGGMYLDIRRLQLPRFWQGLGHVLREGRRRYAGYMAHFGVVALAIGVAGSSLGTRRHEVELSEGEVIHWADREIRYVALEQRQLPDKLEAVAVLEVTHADGSTVEHRPARHLHLLQNEWTTQVAIHTNWSGDFYSVLHAGLGDGRVALTFVENPMLRWIWFGGAITCLSGLAAIWPRWLAPAVTGSRSAVRIGHSEEGLRRRAA
jgi:cytochrome c-type biogenesis protein CcmF